MQGLNPDSTSTSPTWHSILSSYGSYLAFLEAMVKRVPTVLSVLCPQRPSWLLWKLSDT